MKNTRYRHVNKENHLFQFLMRTNKFEQDAQLARWLFTSTSVISQVRNGKIPLSARLVLRIYDKTKLSIEEIRKMVDTEVK